MADAETGDCVRWGGSVLKCGEFTRDKTVEVMQHIKLVNALSEDIPDTPTQPKTLAYCEATEPKSLIDCEVYSDNDVLRIPFENVQ